MSSSCPRHALAQPHTNNLPMKDVQHLCISSWASGKAVFMPSFWVLPFPRVQATQPDLAAEPSWASFCPRPICEFPFWTDIWGGMWPLGMSAPMTLKLVMLQMISASFLRCKDSSNVPKSQCFLLYLIYPCTHANPWRLWHQFLTGHTVFCQIKCQDVIFHISLVLFCHLI